MICKGCVTVPGQIDECVRHLVEVLNAAGYPTISSCCGHGKKNGSIIFKDGTEIEIHPFNQARAVRNWSTMVSAQEIDYMIGLPNG
jgi:hypothetical protein